MSNYATIRIWLGDLAKYNEGSLVGEWLDLPMDDEELQAKVNQYSNDGRSDYFIADYECTFPVREYSDPHKLNQLAGTLQSLDDTDVKRIQFLIGDGCSIDEALEQYEDVQFYEGMHLKDVAYELVADGCFGEIQNYIDYEAIARDLRMDGYDEVEGVGVFCLTN